MNGKDFRELQLSSTQLIVIFVGILIIGVVIFLLGVSVGKKQSQIAEESTTVAKKEIAQAADKKPVPVQKAKSEKPKETTRKGKKSETIKKELASHKEIKEKTRVKTAPTGKENLYYIQIGAYEFKRNALNIADGFKKKGYPSIVINPLSLDKKPWYRVRVGGYKSREEAEEIMSQLLKLGITKKSDYFIVER
ncbi:MAG: SPOR domain-containing protein [Candidatus Aminicenantes bacterium]|nr:MAG: SPOR domain-containing protein [Candidatus Aminicenantes bacterium]